MLYSTFKVFNVQHFARKLSFFFVDFQFSIFNFRNRLLFANATFNMWNEKCAKLAQLTKPSTSILHFTDQFCILYTFFKSILWAKFSVNKDVKRACKHAIRSQNVCIFSLQQKRITKTGIETENEEKLNMDGIYYFSASSFLLFNFELFSIFLSIFFWQASVREKIYMMRHEMDRRYFFSYHTL